MNQEFTMAQSSKRVAIIGGGVAGSTVALFLAKQGVDVTLFDKNKSLVSGPPICHLHAGGNLYREISQQQCLDLLKQSIDFVRFFPSSVNVRPTVIAVPKVDDGEPLALLPRLKVLREAYRGLINEDADNNVLGSPDDYFHEYDYEQLRALSQRDCPKAPSSLDEWLIPFAKYTDLEQLKFPIYVVQEYGLSLFRVASSVQLWTQQLDNLHVRTSVVVDDIEALESHYEVSLDNGEVGAFDFVINACGFRTGSIDDKLEIKRQRLVEFKAAYVTKWKSHQEEKWPEVIFHGKRGTPQGMAQLTPYPDGYFQLHGMTKKITLFDKGLVGSTTQTSQPELPQSLINKIDKGWPLDVQIERSKSAIRHVSQFVPDFSTAEPAGKPLYGAQQIPGNEASLRTADVSFEGERYARLEIVKASSALIAAKKIMSKWFVQQPQSMVHTYSLDPARVQEVAMNIAKERGYPESLAIAY
ncbi:FAD-binding oxidoreductase [Vibrio sp. SCSIO 43140]|uniref:FAD-dependent oxidoreductase n=1 Tax=Vibrio sp. SCSIO 43140 TaxID=2819100 RepID=UPI0020757C00|nr:FAD-dependent oxidoreductase [Vibrio sp. SCSIO 43140]USD62259.1 FAD-binding oxidoreductase [Vibrio sp. SCSIO 43140]